MQCKCGYRFRPKFMDVESNEFESYAVIDDKDYQKFLKSEMRVLMSKGENAKLEAIAHSSKYVGSLLVCPECSRLVFLKPRAELREYYSRED